MGLELGEFMNVHSLVPWIRQIQFATKKLVKIYPQIFIKAIISYQFRSYVVKNLIFWTVFYHWCHAIECLSMNGETNIKLYKSCIFCVVGKYMITSFRVFDCFCFFNFFFLLFSLIPIGLFVPDNANSEVQWDAPRSHGYCWDPLYLLSYAEVLRASCSIDKLPIQGNCWAHGVMLAGDFIEQLFMAPGELFFPGPSRSSILVGNLAGNYWFKSA
jgi:hypothetical protein